MKTSFFALALVTSLLLSSRQPLVATVVSCQFSGYLSSVNNPSNALPAGTVYGAPFTGSFSYDTTANVNGIDFNSSTNIGNFYFNGPGFNLSMTFAGHTFSNLTSFQADSGYSSIVTKHNVTGDTDSIQATTGSSRLTMDGGPLPGFQNVNGLILGLDDATQTALSSDALPTTFPQLAAFPTAHRIELIAYVQNASLTYSVIGTITNISVLQNPPLAIRAKAGGQVELAWPLTAQGFSLQQNTNLIAGTGWQTNSTTIVDTASEHTVTVTASGSRCFFRLISP